MTWLRRPAALAAIAVAVIACGAAVATATSPTPSQRPTATATSSPGSPADVCHVNGIVFCALNPAVTDANVQQTICNPAWTHNLRPPSSLTDRWKQLVLDAYRLPGSIGDYEGDHREPEAALGGDPGAHLVTANAVPTEATNWVVTDQLVTLPTGARVPANFADEVPPSPNAKDRDETALHDQVCAGHLTLTAARVQLRDKWLAPYPGYRA